MKPDWNDAPEWAQYLAMDENGAWWWYDDEPVLGVRSFNPNGCKVQEAFVANWESTLEQRPCE